MRALVVSLALISGAASAQTVVRGGEHGDFTRLALAVEGPGAWSVEPLEDGWRIAVEGADAFDLSEVWRRIGRSRVAGIADDDGGLLIIAGCECDLAATEFPDGILALDIGPDVAALPRPLPTPPEPEALPAIVRPFPLLPRAAPGIETARQVPGVVPARAGPTADSGAGPSPDAPFRAALAGALSAGVDSGILRPAAPVPDDLANLVEGDGHAASEGTDRVVIRPDGPLAGLSTDCPPADLLEAGTEPGPPLYGEFDALSEPATIAEVRRLISDGLLPEAGATLGLLPDGAEAPAGDLLRVVRAFLGEDPAWRGCGPGPEIWSLLAGGAITSSPYDIAGAVVALPTHLRDLVGPRIALALARDGGTEGARRILAALGPAAGRTGASLIAEAWNGEGDEAAALLQRAVEGGDAHAPVAAIALLERRPSAAPLDRIAVLVSDDPSHPQTGRLSDLAAAEALRRGRADLAIGLAETGEGAWEAIAAHLRSAPLPAFVRLVREHASALARAELDPSDRAAIESRLRRSWHSEDGAPPTGDLPPAPAPLAWLPVPRDPVADASGPLELARAAVDAADRAEDLLGALGPEG
ncbi:MAG: hypothetical protein ACU0BS_10690 [Hasllibacter sp.]